MYLSPVPPAAIEAHFKTRMRSIERQFAEVTDSTEPLSAREPIPEYIARLDAVRDGLGELSARFVGWRYIVLWDEQFVAQTSIPMSEDGLPLCGGTQYGKLQLDGLKQALEAMEGVIPADACCELRIFSVPALGVSVLWLKELIINGTRQQTGDRFLCIGPKASTLVPLQVYGVEFWEILRQLEGSCVGGLPSG